MLAAHGLVVLALTVAIPRPAAALIFGGEGNQPLARLDWPAGAAAVFDSKTRIAWWAGPPFGGGQYHAECRGDTAAFNQVLADFAKLDVKTKRLVVHDGISHSSWLNPNRQAAKQVDAQIDWVFMVWNPASWEHLRKLPADLNPTDLKDAKSGPPSQIDVYTGGNIRWADVVVPEGIEVIDQRLEAHGYTAADGEVVEGKVVDVENNRPLAAKIRLEKSAAQAKQGEQPAAVVEVAAGPDGNWVVRKVPEGTFRVLVELDGYAPRLAGYVTADTQPGWRTIDCGLARAANVSGWVFDETGGPLADVRVSLSNIVAGDGAGYRAPTDYSTTTDAKGHYILKDVPRGKGRLSIYKPDYCRPGLGEEVELPANSVVLQMQRSATVTVTVDFGARKPKGEYIVNIEPEGGPMVGLWSGSAQINAENQHTFKDVPPGRYTLHGRPNPGAAREKTKSVTLELTGGQQHAVKLEAKQ